MFARALKRVRPSVNKQQAKEYELLATRIHTKQIDDN